MKYIKAGASQKIVKEDYAKEILFDSTDLPEGGHLLQIVTIPPNTNQRIHSHDQQTEVFLILSGECDIIINGTVFNATPGDAFVCSPGDKHNLHNRSNTEFKLAVFKINLPISDDTHWS